MGIERKHRSLLIPICGALAAALITVLFVSFFRPGSGEEISEQLSKGDRYLSDMEYNRAAAAYKAVLGLDPRNTDAMMGMGNSLQTKGQQVLLSEDPTDEDLHQAYEDLEDAYGYYMDILSTPNVYGSDRQEVLQRAASTEEMLLQLQSYEKDPGAGKTSRLSAMVGDPKPGQASVQADAPAAVQADAPAAAQAETRTAGQTTGAGQAVGSPTGEQYWIVLREDGSEDKWLIAFDSELPAEDLFLIYNGSVILNDGSGTGRYSRYRAGEAEGEWELVSEETYISDFVEEIAASNLDIYTSDAAVFMQKTDFKEEYWNGAHGS